jgi:hypothetical protein
VPRSRIRRAIPPFSQYAFMAWCSVTAQGQLYLIQFRNAPLNNTKNETSRLQLSVYFCRDILQTTLLSDYNNGTVKSIKFVPASIEITRLPERERGIFKEATQ